jgi:hypothetical protein
MFALDLPAVRPAKNPHECCDACKEARDIKCTCTCGGKNHGSALKKDVKPLDEFSKTGTETLASQPEVLRLDPLVTRELIYIG